MEKKSRKLKFNRVVAIAATLALLIGCTTIAYATDLGGIQRTVQLWLNGDQTNAVIDFDGNGNYQLEYQDADGETVQLGGGGVAFNPDGSERPLTEEELMEEINAPNVEYKDDGTVWVYYYNQKVEITDKFNDGVCYIQLNNGDDPLYMTVHYKDGYSTSPYKYIED